MSSGDRRLRDDLARYIDNEAFQKVCKTPADRLRMYNRRKGAEKRADAAIRFFSKPEQFVRLRKHYARENDS